MNRRTFLATTAAALSPAIPIPAKSRVPRTSKRLEKFMGAGSISKDTKPQGYYLGCFGKLPGEDLNLPAIVDDISQMHEYHHSRRMTLDNFSAPSMVYLSAGESCPINFQGALKGMEKRIGKEDTYFMTIICPTREGKSRVTRKKEIAFDFKQRGLTGLRHLEESLQKTNPKQGVILIKTNHDAEIAQRLRENERIDWERYLLLHEKPGSQKKGDASPTLQFFLSLRKRKEEYEQENRFPKIHQAASGLPMIHHTSGNYADFSLASFLKD